MVGMVASAAFAACAAVSVFALGFALYAFAEPSLGRAGAAAVVAGVAALTIALGAVVVSLGGGGKPPKREEPAPGVNATLIERALLFFQEKPVIAIAAAIGAGFLTIRNPAYVGSVIRSILGLPEPPTRR